MSADTTVGGAGRPYRVVVADDHGLVRAGFRLLIDSSDRLTVVGEAGTGREAVEVTARERPDVVLMDIQMPGMGGIEATRLICADPGTAAATRVLVLTTYDTDEHVFRALDAGASGFLLKTTPPEELLTAVEVVADGEALLAPSVTRRLIAAFTAGRRAAPDSGAASRDRRLPELTARELETLELVARGLSNTEIAGRLRIGPATVKTHMSRLLAKTHSRDRAQLVIAAYESGLVRAAAPGQDPAPH
ncbi:MULTISPECIES: response regulator transcription factor [Streptomyces]|uniref:response regulator transcription factor n=1 Tax=Streptomyces TaxID=1883 RepID=UPI001F2DB163|nr:MULTISPECIES: response regulator transcription factor [Streptomyces]